MPGVPGKGGRMPKRSNERMGHRSKAEQNATQKVLVVGDVEVPPVDEKLHKIAKDWYNSLAKSGQARFFEPSDWAAAAYVAEAIHRSLQREQGMSANLFGGAWSAMNDLLTTEGGRRRIKLELDRVSTGADSKSRSVAAMDAYRQRLAG